MPRFVIQDVTMIDGPTREILKRNPNAHTFAYGHIDDVSPSREAWAPVILAHDLNALVWIWNG